MTERMRKALSDLKTAQDSGEYTLCPRCGCGTMKPDLPVVGSCPFSWVLMLLLSLGAPCVFWMDEL